MHLDLITRSTQNPTRPRWSINADYVGLCRENPSRTVVDWIGHINQSCCSPFRSRLLPRAVLGLCLIAEWLPPFCSSYHPLVLFLISSGNPLILHTVRWFMIGFPPI